MKIQLIRHATMLIEINGRSILVDPMLSEAGKMQLFQESLTTLLIHWSLYRLILHQ